MVRQLRHGASIMTTWFGSAALPRRGPVGDLVPTMRTPAFVQHPTRRNEWLALVRKPEHAPQGSTVTLHRHRV